MSETNVEDEADDTVARLASGIKVDDATQDKLKKVAKDMQRSDAPGDKDSAKMDDVLDAAELHGVRLNPNQQKDMEKNVVDKAKEDSVKETIFDLPVIDEDDLEEKKRRFSFSPQEFGRGIVTTPADKRKRSAKRGLTIFRK